MYNLYFKCVFNMMECEENMQCSQQCKNITTALIKHQLQYHNSKKAF
jgi:hypothetical protein